MALLAADDSSTVDSLTGGRIQSAGASFKSLPRPFCRSLVLTVSVLLTDVAAARAVPQPRLPQDFQG